MNMPISDSDARLRAPTPLITVDRQRDGERGAPDGSDDLQGILSTERHARNRARLVALMAVLGVSGADIARAARVSTALVSKILHGRPAINPDTLYSRLESALADLVRTRSTPLFEHDGTDITAVLETTLAMKSISPSGRGRFRQNRAA